MKITCQHHRKACKLDFYWKICAIFFSGPPDKGQIYSGSGVTGGGGVGVQSEPQRLLTGKFLLTYWEKRGKEKREKGWKLRRKGGKLEMEEQENVINGGEDFSFFSFFFFFFFFFFCFSLLKTTKICFWVYQNANFLPGKSISRRGKKSRKMTLPPQKNTPDTPLFSIPPFCISPPNKCLWTVPNKIIIPGGENM